MNSFSMASTSAKATQCNTLLKTFLALSLMHSINVPEKLWVWRKCSYSFLMLSGTLLKMSHSSHFILYYKILYCFTYFSGMYNTLRIYFNVCYCFIVSLTLQQDHSASHLLELADNPRPLLVSWLFIMKDRTV